LSLVIILKVDLADRQSFDPEGQPIVTRNGQAPHASPTPFERMQPPPWDCFQFGDIFGFFERSQHRAELCFMSPRDTACFVASPESLKVLVSETDDAHRSRLYGITVQMSK